MRTNSESIVAVTAPDDTRDFTASVAISSSIYPDPDTHIELVTYGAGGGAMKTMFTALVGDGTRVTRPLRWLAAIARHPVRFARLLATPNWSRRTVIVLVMQTVDSALRFAPRPRRLSGGVRITTEQDATNPNPTFIPAANHAARWLAERIGGIPQSGIPEALFNVPGDRAHPRRRGHRRRPLPRRDRRARPRVRLSEPADHRRLGATRQPGREPKPDDHRASRAHDRPSAPARTVVDGMTAR